MASRAIGPFRFGKRGFDIIGSLLLLPVLGLAAVVLAMINPVFNPGPLIFSQQRMGQDCLPFIAYKFRSMRPVNTIGKSALARLEHDRITCLGSRLRRSRIDELPQIVNVLKGEMSLIGPRPDCLTQALDYVQTVRGYRERHGVRPGISGLAQTEIGYTQGRKETRRKVLYDLHYIRHAGFRMEIWIVWRTLCTVAGLRGL